MRERVIWLLVIFLVALWIFGFGMAEHLKREGVAIPHRAPALVIILVSALAIWLLTASNTEAATVIRLTRGIEGKSSDLYTGDGGIATRSRGLCLVSIEEHGRVKPIAERLVRGSIPKTLLVRSGLPARLEGDLPIQHVQRFLQDLPRRGEHRRLWRS